MNDQEREQIRRDADVWLNKITCHDGGSLEPRADRLARHCLALLDNLDQRDGEPERTSWKELIYEPNPDREHARDQLAAATVRTYQQMRADQERIAELEHELAEAQQGITKLIQTIGLTNT